MALLDGEIILAEDFINTGENHSLHLLPAINNLYERAGLSFEKTDIFVCTQGPGSFTGIRVGICTIKGLALATAKPIIGISSLEALCANVALPSVVCPMIDARNDQVYAALYEHAEGYGHQEIEPENLLDIKSLLLILKEKHHSIIFVGSGALKYAELISEVLPHSLVSPPHFCHVRAGAVGLLGLNAYTKGTMTEAISFAPHYLRLSEAERKLSLLSSVNNKGVDNH